MTIIALITCRGSHIECSALKLRRLRLKIRESETKSMSFPAFTSAARARNHLSAATGMSPLEPFAPDIVAEGFDLMLATPILLLEEVADRRLGTSDEVAPRHIRTLAQLQPTLPLWRKRTDPVSPRVLETHHCDGIVVAGAIPSGLDLFNIDREPVRHALTAFKPLPAFVHRTASASRARFVGGTVEVLLVPANGCGRAAGTWACLCGANSHNGLPGLASCGGGCVAVGARM